MTNCPECEHMKAYEDEDKWPEICGMCGRPTSRLKDNEEGGKTNDTSRTD